MAEIETLGGERIRLGARGDEAFALTVTHPRFGSVSTVRLDTEAAAELAGALTGLLLDRDGVPEPGADPA